MPNKYFKAKKMFLVLTKMEYIFLPSVRIILQIFRSFTKQNFVNDMPSPGYLPGMPAIWWIYSKQ